MNSYNIYDSVSSFQCENYHVSANMVEIRREECGLSLTCINLLEVHLVILSVKTTLQCRMVININLKNTSQYPNRLNESLKPSRQQGSSV